MCAARRETKMSSDNSVNPPSYQHLLNHHHLSNSTSAAGASAFDSSANNQLPLNSGRPTSNSSGNLSANERRTSIRTQQLNSLNDKKNQMIRNNSTRSFGGRIAGRNPLYAQSSLPTKYEFETPGQAVQLGNDQSPSTDQSPSNQLSSDVFNNQSNGAQAYNSSPDDSHRNCLASHRNSYPNNLYNQMNTLMTPPPPPNNPSRPKLTYQPRSNDSDHTTSYLSEVRSEAAGSNRDEHLNMAEKFKSNYEKFLQISRSIDFEEKLINLQLNKSKLKASARTSALLAGFAMVSESISFVRA